MTESTSRQLERIRFPKGTKIFREREPGSCAYLIEEGKIEISSEDHGQKLVISQIGKGELFGEMSLIDNLKRSATATVLEDAVVITLDRTQFESKISTADPVLHMLLRVVLKRFRWALRKALSNDRMQMTGSLGSGGQTMMFDSAHSEAIRQIRMEHDLHEALKQRQFELHYQPIVATSDLRIQGFEALIRWRHPERGMLAPSEFISSAEASQLIVPIGEWVLQQGCADLARLQSEQPDGREPLFMTVNVSAQQIRHLACDGHLDKILSDAKVSPEDLKIEFTESVLIENPEVAALALADIKRLGVRLAIDDFGTGYSSLSYLQRFPLDVLKIDRSFIAGMTADEDSQRIVRAIVGLSKSLALEVIAEGIETRGSLELLTQFGCDLVQGFLLSKPVSFQDAVSLVKADQDYTSALDEPLAPTAASG